MPITKKHVMYKFTVGLNASNLSQHTCNIVFNMHFLTSLQIQVYYFFVLRIIAFIVDKDDPSHTFRNEVDFLFLPTFQNYSRVE